MKCTVTTFRSTLLCRKLITEDLRCTRTARHKKTENCFLASPVDIKKKKHGNFEFALTEKHLYVGGRICGAFVVSNFADAESSNSIQKWSATKK